MRVIFPQYTNPAAYPPLEHSSRILAHLGWQILFVGVHGRGTEALEFPFSPNITVKRLPYVRPGWMQKLHYLAFTLWTLFWTVAFRPTWVYASDVLSCPAALLLTLWPGMRVLYHEHDAPTTVATASAFQSFVLWSRKHLARRATLCVVPNQKRASHFKMHTATTRPVFSVWNCPSLDDLPQEQSCFQDDRFIVFYHGSIVPARLPMTVVEALSKLAEHIVFHFAGYETIGHIGYIDSLCDYAHKLNVADRFKYLGVVPTRSSLLEQCRRAKVGLTLMPLVTDDFNEQAMAGASNKAFDYMASGLALLVSELPDWKEAFVAPGFALMCDPTDPDSIAQSLRWFAEHPSDTDKMGRNGQMKIAGEWNYEKQFLPVAALMAGNVKKE